MGRPKKEDAEADQSKSVSLTTKVLIEFKKKYDAAKQKVTDSASAVGNIMQGFQEQGGNNQAFKLATKLAAMEELKAQDFLRSLHIYLTEFGVYEQLDMLDEVPNITKGAKKAQPPASAQRAAAGAIH
jgi:hypothetical protein